MSNSDAKGCGSIRCRIAGTALGPSMPAIRASWFPIAVSIALFLAGAALAEPNRVTFPENLDQLTHYTTVTRGNVTEHMLTSPAALDAIKKGQPVPSGSHFVLADHRDGKIYRYFIMQKGEKWAADYDDRRRTDDWQFQWFWPDKSINMQENTARCQSCHRSQAASDYMFLRDRITKAD